MKLISMNGRAEDDLSSLGFTATEAGLHFTLLSSGPVTACRLAKLVSKAPENAHQALAVLTPKGAVASDEGEPKIYRSAEPPQLCAGLGGEVDAWFAAAGQVLAGLATPVPDDRIHQLDGASAVPERTRGLISGAATAA